MKRLVLTAGLVLGLAPFIVAQDNASNGQSSTQTTTANTQTTTTDNSGQENTTHAHAAPSSTPKGTRVVGHHEDTIVQPEEAHVKVNKKTVEAAQKALTDRGYNPGTADGIDGPQTRAATSKFQADQGLTQTGRLDADTLEKLNVGGPQTLGAAGHDFGRGGKAFGHDVKEGHPVEAGKALGEGTVNGAKKVGKGSESLAKEGAQKVGSGLSTIGNKIDNKAKGDTNNPHDQNKNDQNNGNQNPQ
ncbi:MAG TPA: peptidoglycan-binding domain-containing protein [Terriglobales bacterium]|nr:peptidoglycan-binding domain-containing protein [Terriglobales bacterium]